MQRVRQSRLVLHTLALSLFLLIVISWQSASFHDRAPRSIPAKIPVSRTPASSDGTLQLLSARLRKLESQPIASYEDSLGLNKRTCEGREKQSNIDQINGQSSYWESLSSETLYEKRQNVIDGLRKEFGLPGLLESRDMDILRSPMYGDGTRGIVYTGGNADTLERVYNSMRILRYRAKSSLPVEIFSFPEELQAGPGEGIRGKIEELGNVTFKTLHSSTKLKIWKNFQIKGEAIVKSSFSEVLYLDSDNVLLADPTFLFDHPVYKRHGVVFWPDITKDGPANPIWRMLGKQCEPNQWQLDSGQIIIDKRGQKGMNLAGLLAASKMQEEHEFWFGFAGGDKDTFRYGFYLLDLPYTPAPHWLGSYGAMHNYDKDGHTFCGLAMLQFSLSPDDWLQYPSAQPEAVLAATHAPPLFVHANLLKHSSNYQRGKYFTHVKHFKPDLTDRSSNKPRTVVYHSRQGMCVDMWDSFDEVDPRPDGTFDNGDIILEEAKTAFGGVFDGFEEMYWWEGGKAGGF